VRLRATSIHHLLSPPHFLNVTAPPPPRPPSPLYLSPAGLLMLCPLDVNVRPPPLTIVRNYPPSPSDDNLKQFYIHPSYSMKNNNICVMVPDLLAFYVFIATACCLTMADQSRCLQGSHSIHSPNEAISTPGNYSPISLPSRAFHMMNFIMNTYLHCLNDLEDNTPLTF
jgi:hypothetical protein